MSYPMKAFYLFYSSYSCLENPMDGGAWQAAVHGVAKSQTRLSDFTFTFHFHALEKEMATHSSVLAWRTPGMGEPGRLPSMQSHRVGHDWSDLAVAAVILVSYISRWNVNQIKRESKSNKPLQLKTYKLLLLRFLHQPCPMQSCHGGWREAWVCVLHFPRKFSLAQGFTCPSKGNTTRGVRETVFQRILRFCIFTSSVTSCTLLVKHMHNTNIIWKYVTVFLQLLIFLKTACIPNNSCISKNTTENYKTPWLFCNFKENI